MSYLPIPNYIIIEIFNHLVGIKLFAAERIQLRLIAKLRLISKDWNENVIPRIQFNQLSIKLKKGRNFGIVKKLLSMGICGFNLEINSKWFSEIVDYLTQSKSQCKVSIMLDLGISSTPEEHWNIIRNSNLLIDFVIFGSTDSLYHNSPPSIDAFIGVKHIELSNLGISPNMLIKYVEIIQPENFQLRSTPYTYDNYNHVDSLFDHIATKNKSITYLSNYNYTVLPTMRTIINLLNCNKTLKEFRITSLVVDTETHWEIHNSTLELVSYQLLIPLWKSDSKLTIIDFFDFGPQIFEMIPKYFKNLKQLVFTIKTENQHLLSEIIKLNCSIEDLTVHTTYSYKDLYNQKIIDSLSQNNHLKSLNIGHAYNDFISKFFKLNHPTISNLIVIPENHNFLLDVENDLIMNKTLKVLICKHMPNFVKDSLYLEILSTIISILEKNNNIIVFQYPYLSQNDLPTDKFVKISNLINNNNSLLKLDIFTSFIPKIKSLLDNKFIIN
ncbi:hypothetical protein DLAC_11752 [Tieghemostelium lacteum]|uniref:F-box domain-containing protein n=1 Tax=Tieghemostelium lacteum TaxID=361077 RepID=A0A151Z8N2_TIELA|nr:hypothetical protein DLAC_11752 [Tieghemostelium lacteum]|eukprot:KYQ90301.1 hypothetical protein DLAC_11752 [Tieghemostelium lacteum]